MDMTRLKLERMEAEIRRIHRKLVEATSWGADTTIDGIPALVSGTSTKLLAEKIPGTYYAQAYVKTETTGGNKTTESSLAVDTPNNNAIVLRLLLSEDDGTGAVVDRYIDVNAPFKLDALTSDPSSGPDGLIWYNATTDKYRGFLNGSKVTFTTSGGVYHKANNGTSGTGPGATTSETSLGSFTVTGGDMGTTGILRVRLIGHFVASGATSTVRIRVKFGGSTVYDDTSVTTAVDLPWFAEIHVANVGSASSQRIGGLIIIGANGATTGYGNLGTDEVNATTPIYATSSVNTASDQTFEVTAQLSNGTSPNSFLCFSLVAELL